MEEITQNLSDFIRERFDIGSDPEYSNDAHLFDMGFVDSFGAMEIINYVEKTFSIRITQKDITLYPMNTVNEIAEVVFGKIS